MPHERDGDIFTLTVENYILAENLLGTFPNISEKNTNAAAFGAGRIVVVGDGGIIQVSNLINKHSRSGVIITRVTAAEGKLDLAFNSEQGFSYSIEKSLDLFTWTSLESNIRGTGMPISRTIQMELGVTEHFYRVLKE